MVGANSQVIALQSINTEGTCGLIPKHIANQAVMEKWDRITRCREAFASLYCRSDALSVSWLQTPTSTIACARIGTDCVFSPAIFIRLSEIM